MYGFQTGTERRIGSFNRITLSFVYIYLIYRYLPIGIDNNSPLIWLILGIMLHLWVTFILISEFHNVILSHVFFPITFAEILLLSYFRSYSYFLPYVIFLIGSAFYLLNLLGIMKTESTRNDSQISERIGELKAQLIHYERTHQLQNITASFVHEVNNPLTHMEGNVFFIQEQQEKLSQLLSSGTILNGEARETLNDILDELASISRQYEVGFTTVQKLIKRMKRVYFVTQKDKPQLVNAVEVLEDVIMLTVPQHLRKFLKVTAPERIDIFIQELDLVSLFSNPLKNAMEAVAHLKDKREIIINLSIKKMYTPHIKYSVKDNGKGFCDTGKPKGMGMGLKICSRISESNGGFIETGNRETGGAIVNIILPLNKL